MTVLLCLIIWTILALIFWYLTCKGWRNTSNKKKPEFMVVFFLWPWIFIKLIYMIATGKLHK